MLLVPLEAYDVVGETLYSCAAATVCVLLRPYLEQKMLTPAKREHRTALRAIFSALSLAAVSARPSVSCDVISVVAEFMVSGAVLPGLTPFSVV
jgi:hypothetical protein